MPSDRREEPCGTSDVVRARGRARVLMGLDPGSSGVVALACDDNDVVELAVWLSIVWYVRTGNRSTTDFGARHLLRRILDRRSKRAYTTVSVTRGDTTRTSSVSKKGEEDIEVCDSVTHSPS